MVIRIIQLNGILCGFSVVQYKVNPIVRKSNREFSLFKRECLANKSVLPALKRSLYLTSPMKGSFRKRYPNL